MYMFVDCFDILFEEVVGLLDVDMCIVMLLCQVFVCSEWCCVMDSEKCVLCMLVMYLCVVLQFDDEQIVILCVLLCIGELFVEVVDYVCVLGEGVEFWLLLDVLRMFLNGVIYEEIFCEILDYDENVCDLLLQNLEDEMVFEW